MEAVLQTLERLAAEQGQLGLFGAQA